MYSSVTATVVDYNRNISDSGEYSRKITNITMHESFNAGTSDYDFALLKLETALNFTDWSTQKICLPTSCTDGCNAGTPVFIAGWGLLAERDLTPPNVMQHTFLYLRDTAACKTQYFNQNKVITDRMMCAGWAEGGVDACVGDTGGPLMSAVHGYYQLCGISSFGNGCARAGYPGVYSRVCSVLDWIKRNAV